MTREDAIADIRDNIKPVVGGKSLDMAINALEQEPCADAISRQAVLDAISSDRYDYLALFEYVKQLQPVTPAEKVGQWEWVQYYCDPILGDWVCSECKSVAVEGVMKYNEEAKPTYKYCPQCGCKMQEVEE